MSVSYGIRSNNRVMSTSQIQKVLDENSQLISTIQDYQTKGKSQECLHHQQLLHRNLVHLTNMADSNQNLHALLPPPQSINHVGQHQPHPVQMNEQPLPNNYNNQINMANQSVAYRNMPPMVHRPNVNATYTQRPYQPQQQYAPQYSNQPQSLPPQSQNSHPYGQPQMNSYNMYGQGVYATNAQSGYGTPQSGAPPQSPSAHSVYAAQPTYVNNQTGAPVYSSQSVPNPTPIGGYSPVNSPVSSYAPPNSYVTQGSYQAQQMYGQAQPQQTNAYHPPHSVNSNYCQPNLQSSPYNGNTVTSSQNQIQTTPQSTSVPSPQSYSQAYPQPTNTTQNPNTQQPPNSTYPQHPPHPSPSNSPYDQQVSSTSYNYGANTVAPHTAPHAYTQQPQYGPPQTYQSYQRPSQPNQQTNPNQPPPPTQAQYSYNYPQA